MLKDGAMSRATGLNVASLRQLLPIVWTDAGTLVKSRLALVVLLVMAGAVLSALAPTALKWLVDGFAGPEREPSVSVTLLIGLYVLSLWLVRMIGEIRGYVFARAERRMYRMLSERLFGHVMQLPLRFHLDRRTGAIQQTLTSGLEGFHILLHDILFTFLPVLVELGVIVFVLARLDHAVFLGLFGGALACYSVAFALGAKRVGASANSASAAHIDESAVMTDGILNYETVKYFAAEPIMRDRVSDALARTEDEWVRFYRYYAVTGICVSVIFAAFFATSTVYAGQQVERGHMTIGDFVLINTYLLQVVRPVELFGQAIQRLSQGLAFLGKLLELLRELPEPAHRIERSSETAGGQKPASLVFDNVSLTYGPERAVLRGVSFSIQPGRTVGVVGASGAGKSSLVRLLVRLVEPDGGRILLDDEPIAGIPLRTLREAIAVVPQDTVLFNDTIGYNIAFGRPGSSQEEIELAARLAHLHDFVSSLPEKYDTRVGERGVKLSGGEKQRVSIARAALKRPRIYVFDEATSSLDSKTEREIVRNLSEISSSTTTVVIAHRLSTVVHADEIVVLDGGVVVERGNHAFLLRRGARYAALWRAQQSGSAEGPFSPPLARAE
ncbi:MAG: ATP-binding cassette domain-containing protein [Gammaproteobacteria bacterium]